MKDILNKKIEFVDISPRVYRSLKLYKPNGEYGFPREFVYIRDVLEASVTQLLMLKDMGPAAIVEFHRALIDYIIKEKENDLS